MQISTDPMSEAIERLPPVIHDDVHRPLALRNVALARAHDPEVFYDDEAVVAASAIVQAYTAALRTISEAYEEPVLDLGQA